MAATAGMLVVHALAVTYACTMPRRKVVEVDCQLRPYFLIKDEPLPNSWNLPQIFKLLKKGSDIVFRYIMIMESLNSNLA